MKKFKKIRAAMLAAVMIFATLATTASANDAISSTPIKLSSGVTVSPEAPDVKVASKTSNSVTFNWVEPVTAATYDLSYKVNGETEWTNVNNIKGSSYTLEHLKANTTYLYSFRTKAGELTGKWGSTGAVITNAVAGLTTPALSGTSSAIRVTWDEVEGATSYKFGYSIDKNEWTYIVSTSNYAYFPVTPGNTYYYCVKAMNGADSSEWSAITSITIDPQDSSLNTGETKVETGKYITKGTKTMECEACLFDGECQECFGSGQTCNAILGYIDCFKCKGTGKCVVCKGKGEANVEVNIINEDAIPEGKEFDDCYMCDGLGICDNCNGLKYSYGAKECIHCKATGICSTCKGTGGELKDKPKPEPKQNPTPSTSGSASGSSSGTVSTPGITSPILNRCYGCFGTKICNYCHGARLCQTCFGKGGRSVPTYGMGGSGWVTCTACYGTRHCKKCGGSGKCQTCGGF